MVPERDIPPEKISYRESVTCRRAVGELTHLSNLRAELHRLARCVSQFLDQLPQDDCAVVARHVLRRHLAFNLRPGIAGIRNWFQSRLKTKQ